MILSLLADIIVAQRVAAQVFILSSSPPIGNSPNSLTAADVNRDGWVDLIVAAWLDDTGSRLGCCGGSLIVLTNNGNGTFTASSTNTVKHPAKVEAADLNGDGWLDLIAANTDTNTVTVLTNNRNGTFTASSTNVVGLGPFFATAADVNGDGKLDLITADRAWHLEPFPAGSTLTVLTNNGDGTFTLSAVRNSPPATVRIFCEGVTFDSRTVFEGKRLPPEIRRFGRRCSAV